MYFYSSICYKKEEETFKLEKRTSLLLNFLLQQGVLFPLPALMVRNKDYTFASDTVCPVPVLLSKLRKEDIFKHSFHKDIFPKEQKSK